MRAARIGFVAVAAGLASYAVTQDLPEVGATFTALRPVQITASALLILLGTITSAAAWRAIVQDFSGNRLPWLASTGRFFLTQLGKYLPGGAWTILAQVDAAERLRVQRPTMGVSAVVFILLHLATGGLVVLVVAVVAPAALPEGYLWVSWPIGGAILLLVPAVARRVVRLVLQRTANGGEVPQMGCRTVLTPALWLGVTWLAFGAALRVLLPAADSADDLFLLSTGVFALAWVVGLLVLPAPAGIGPREVVLYLALAPIIGSGAATSLAILLRTLHTLADLSLAGAALVGLPARSRH